MGAHEQVFRTIGCTVRKLLMGAHEQVFNPKGLLGFRLLMGAHEQVFRPLTLLDYLLSHFRPLVDFSVVRMNHKRAAHGRP